MASLFTCVWNRFTDSRQRVRTIGYFLSIKIYPQKKCYNWFLMLVGPQNEIGFKNRKIGSFQRPARNRHLAEIYHDSKYEFAHWTLYSLAIWGVIHKLGQFTSILILVAAGAFLGGTGEWVNQMHPVYHCKNILFQTLHRANSRGPVGATARQNSWPSWISWSDRPRILAD